MDEAALPQRWVIPPKPKPSPTQALGGARQAHLLELVKSTVTLIPTQWVRHGILVDGVDFAKFRKGDTKYLNKLIKKAANNMPNHYLKRGNSLVALRLTVHSTIEAMFMPKKSLPYWIDHWYPHGKWSRLRLLQLKGSARRHSPKRSRNPSPTTVSLCDRKPYTRDTTLSTPATGRRRSQSLALAKAGIKRNPSSPTTMTPPTGTSTSLASSPSLAVSCSPISTTKAPSI